MLADRGSRHPRSARRALRRARWSILGALLLGAGISSVTVRASANDGPSASPVRHAGASDDARGAAAKDATGEEYRQAIAEGIADFEAQRYLLALDAFRTAHRLRPSARTWRGIGLSAFAVGEMVEAGDALEHALHDPNNPLDAPQRDEVTRFLERVRANTGRFRIELVPADAALQVDGAKLALQPSKTLVLSRGDHLVVARRAGYADLQRAVNVRGGESEPMMLSLAPIPLTKTDSEAGDRPSPAMSSRKTEPIQPQSSSAQRIAGWSLLAAAPVFGIVAGVVWATGKGRVDSIASYCREKNGCSPAEKDERVAAANLGTYETWTDIAWAAAGISAAAGAVLLINSFASSKGSAALPLHLEPGTGGTLRMTF